MFLDLPLHFRIAFAVLARRNAVMLAENAREIDRVSITYRQGDFVKRQRRGLDQPLCAVNALRLAPGVNRLPQFIFEQMRQPGGGDKNHRRQVLNLNLLGNMFVKIVAYGVNPRIVGVAVADRLSLKAAQDQALQRVHR